jgi:SAM-dependent methyltransferase
VEGPPLEKARVSERYYDDPALYDAMYADVTADVAPLVALMRGAGGPVLEVCCGNGRVLVPALEAGVDAEGLDLSPRMLGALRARLAAGGRSAAVHEADMRTFELARRYALVLIAFNSFLHNLTQADQLATLRRCRAHLAPGGRLVLVAFHPAVDKLLEWAAGEKVAKEIPDGTGPGRVRVVDATSDDRIEQVRTVVRRVEFLDAAGAVTRTERVTLAIRYVFKPEMELLLRVAGFARWSATPLLPDGHGALSLATGRAASEGDTLVWSAWAEA